MTRDWGARRESRLSFAEGDSSDEGLTSVKSPATPNDWNARIASLFGTDQACGESDLTDVTFVVKDMAQTEDEQRGACAGGGGAETRFKAHKFLLALRSPVFEAMFYGPMAESTKEIVVPDVTPTAFKAMLNYLYTDKVVFHALVSVWQLWYVAKKYMLDGLEETCRRVSRKFNRAHFPDLSFRKKNFFSI